MTSYNKIILVGRPTTTPEMRYTQKGTSYSKFSLAVDRPTKKDEEKITDFFGISAWDKQAEICSQYLKKGSLVLVEGRLHANSYVDTKTGEKKKSYEIAMNSMQMLGSKKDNEQQADSTPPEDTTSLDSTEPEGYSTNGIDDVPF